MQRFTIHALALIILASAATMAQAQAVTGRGTAGLCRDGDRPTSTTELPEKKGQWPPDWNWNDFWKSTVGGAAIGGGLGFIAGGAVTIEFGGIGAIPAWAAGAAFGAVGGAGQYAFNYAWDFIATYPGPGPGWALSGGYRPGGAYGP